MKDFRCNTNEINEHKEFVDSVLNPPTIKELLYVITDRKTLIENPSNFPTGSIIRLTDLSPVSEAEVGDAMDTIKRYCSENPTCERCPFAKTKVLNKNGGCYFRYHSPREWKY